MRACAWTIGNERCRQLPPIQRGVFFRMTGHEIPSCGFLELIVLTHRLSISRAGSLPLNDMTVAYTATRMFVIYCRFFLVAIESSLRSSHSPIQHTHACGLGRRHFRTIKYCQFPLLFSAFSGLISVSVLPGSWQDIPLASCQDPARILASWQDPAPGTPQAIFLAGPICFSQFFFTTVQPSKGLGMRR